LGKKKNIKESAAAPSKKGKSQTWAVQKGNPAKGRGRTSHKLPKRGGELERTSAGWGR